ncbi:transposase [Acuticoccus yangtzensis]|uniref:transposase n=1 Tax=Acuticoccus yangtzensis TaxID=1443441 RepID=UPI0009498F03
MERQTSERRRRIFPAAFKREAALRVTKSGQPIVRVGEELELHERVLRRWIASYGSEGTALQRRPTAQSVAPSPADLTLE